MATTQKTKINPLSRRPRQQRRRSVAAVVVVVVVGSSSHSQRLWRWGEIVAEAQRPEVEDEDSLSYRVREKNVELLLSVTFVMLQCWFSIHLRNMLWYQDQGLGMSCVIMPHTILSDIIVVWCCRACLCALLEAACARPGFAPMSDRSMTSE